MFERLDQKQFEHALDVLILYKQTCPKKNVYINDKSVKEAFAFMQTHGKDLADQMGMVKEESD